MKAIVRHRYGGPEVLQFEDLPVPVAGEDQVLVRVRAASVNPVDWHMMTGVPYLTRIGAWRQPKDPGVGTDLAGIVEQAGAKVTRFRPGDAVFGMRSGAFAEYVAVRADRVAAIPGNVTFEQAAAAPVAGLTALQGLRDHGGIQAGQRVLINGAAGGVGTFGVQIAKAFGAEVSAVCSTRNVEMVRSLGADRVIDYTTEDFVQSGQYDLILDVAGNRSIAERRRALKPRGTLVMVGGPKHNRWIGPLGSMVAMTVAGKLGTRRMVGMLTKNNAEDLESLAGLMREGKVTPVVERTYPLPEAAQALGYLGGGHARAKLVLTL